MSQETQHYTAAQWEERYGSTTPPWRLVLIFLRHAAVLDLGTSFRFPTTTVQSLILRSFPPTFLVVLLAIGVALLVGVPLGILAALKQGTWIDRLAMFVSMIGQTIPSYVLAVVFILFFSVRWHMLPTSGWGSAKQAVLPVMALALGPIAGFARYMRGALIDALREDYVRTAYAKGGNLRHVLFRHALRNSLIPLITISGPQFAFLMVGSVWIETMFNIPGLGRLFATALPTRDYPLVVSSVFFFAVLIMIVNLLVDIAYGVLDPRIRASYGARPKGGA
jgi:peptide/nickel transport system permease protein